MENIIAQGAEAIIILNKKQVTKKRISKSYRLKELDEKIRKRRTRGEAKLLKKASELIDIPKIISDNESSKEIVLEYIEGQKLSEYLDKFPLAKQKTIMKKIATSLAKLHDKDLIHGDLTTSNLILKDNKVYFIDFGLGFVSKRLEDKAVDIHVLKEALEAKHFKNWKELFKEFLNNYDPKEKELILTQLEKVESRGRYRH